MYQIIINDTKDQALFKKIIQDFVKDPDNENAHKAYLKNPDTNSYKIAWFNYRFGYLQGTIEFRAMQNRIAKHEPAYTFNTGEADYVVMPILKQYVDKPGWEQLRQEIIDLCWKIDRYQAYV